MRVTLLHNKLAGSEIHADGALEACLERHRHELVDVVNDPNGLIASLAELSCDLVVVAGGDGTVSRAACAIAGFGIPIAILPLGTANNTARSLGIDGEIEALVRAWDLDCYRDFDLARIDHLGPLDVSFSEAVGWGAFPEVIARAREASSPEWWEGTLERDRALFREVVEGVEPHAFELELDGETLSGDYLLVEIVNIPFIGPRLELSPGSDPGDGQLEVVCAAEGERERLIELATHGRLESAQTLPSRRARRVMVRTGAGSLHHDGALIRRPRRESEWTITVAPASVRVLTNPN